MNLKLRRRSFTPDGIFSELFDSAENLIAVTLEHSFDLKPKIPDGVYTCVRGVHELHALVPFETFEVTGVVGHTGILFHQGNWNKDSDGCILLGTQALDKMVTESGLAFAKFMKLQTGLNSFVLTVVSPGVASVPETAYA